MNLSCQLPQYPACRHNFLRASLHPIFSMERLRKRFSLQSPETTVLCTTILPELLLHIDLRRDLFVLLLNPYHTTRTLKFKFLSVWHKLSMSNTAVLFWFAVLRPHSHSLYHLCIPFLTQISSHCNFQSSSSNGFLKESS